MNKWLLTISLLLSVVSANSQALTSKQWKDIQSSNDYIIGMGMSESMDQARLIAMSDLVGKISSDVKSRFEYILKNKDNKQSSGEMKKIIQSYSSVKLDNISEHIERNHGKFVIYRYMKNSELRTMFKRRINMAKEWAEVAIKRETERKIGDALQDFYWSLALLRTCPDADLEEFEGSRLMNVVFHKVKDILRDVSVKAIATEKEGYSQRLTLDIKYKGEPVTNFNYKYLNGKNYSSVYTAKDGIGDLLIPANAKMSKLNIYAELTFRDEANILPELRDVMESTDPVPFETTEIRVDTKNCPLKESSGYFMQIVGGEKIEIPRISKDAITTEPNTESLYLTTMKSIEKGIALRDYSGLDQYFTTDGWNMFDRLIKYGEAKLLKSPEVWFTQSRQGVVCRSFPMSFSFKDNKKTFTEDVVFYLSPDGKVNEVAFGLGQTAINDIIHRESWTIDEQQLLIHFLETYKTAYALKRLDYINSIFSKEALIITGSVVKGNGQAEMRPAKMEHVKYTRQTKEQYMKNLERSFRSNEYINLHFSDNIVRRSNKNPNICGIQIKQDYYSSTYGDTGYLFLLIDFEKPDDPIIHVRTWQPDDNPNIKDGRIGLADFLL